MRTGRTGSLHVHRAILEYLDDMEYVALAEERLREAGKTMTWEEVKARLDLL